METATPIVLTGKAIDVFKLCVLRTRLKLEIKGMTCRGKSAYSMCKEFLGAKGSKEEILALMEEKIAEAKQLLAANSN